MLTVWVEDVQKVKMIVVVVDYFWEDKAARMRLGIGTKKAVACLHC
jgi:hypothetical protein